MPAHLKSQAADRPYNKKKDDIYKINTAIVKENLDEIEKGKAFRKRV